MSQSAENKKPKPIGLLNSQTHLWVWNWNKGEPSRSSANKPKVKNALDALKVIVTCFFIIIIIIFPLYFGENGLRWDDEVAVRRRFVCLPQIFTLESANDMKRQNGRGRRRNCDVSRRKLLNLLLLAFIFYVLRCQLGDFLFAFRFFSAEPLSSDKRACEVSSYLPDYMMKPEPLLTLCVILRQTFQWAGKFHSQIVG